MKIGIIGYGVVGKAIDNTISKAFKVVKYDKFADLEKFNSLNSCNQIFISVPTPFDCEIGKVNLSAVLESLNRLGRINYNGIVIIKSTIPPGTCQKVSSEFNYEIVFNPEFLRESTTPNEDFENQTEVVIGTDSTKIYSKVEEMYRKVLSSDANYYHLNHTEAEMVKYSQNTMLACRVAIANIIREACESHNIDYSIIKNIAFDPFEIIGPYMTQVPGPDGKLGFGGKCLPKDIRGFASIHESKVLS